MLPAQRDIYIIDTMEKKYLAIFGLLVVAIFATLSVYNQLKLRSRAKKNMKVEVRLIGELLEMITGLMSSINPERGGVRYAVLMMRLRRIEFTTERVE